MARTGIWSTSGSTTPRPVFPRYWIVDPRHDTITVLTLRDGGYVEHGVFPRGESATSPLLGGIAVDVTATFDVRR